MGTLSAHPGFAHPGKTAPNPARRRRRVRAVLLLLAKNLSTDTLLNPLKVHNVVSAMAPFFSVDGGLDAATIAGLAVELKDVRPRDMVMFTLPTRETGTSTDTLGDYVAANGLEGGN